jgi:hypothetical protein
MLYKSALALTVVYMSTFVRIIYRWFRAQIAQNGIQTSVLRPGLPSAIANYYTPSCLAKRSTKGNSTNHLSLTLANSPVQRMANRSS